MKLFISIDMEGIWGLASWGEDKATLQRAMTRELKWVIDTLKEVVKDKLQITVVDSHAYGENLLLEELPDDIKVIRGYPRKFYMMHGLDESYDGCLFIGYHAPCGKNPGQMDHTYSSSSIFRIHINGREVGETEINALYAGHFNVPVLLVSGDDILCKFSAKYLPDTEFVVTKYAISKHAAKMRPMREIINEYREKITRAMQKIKTIKPLKWDPPYTIEIELLDSTKAYCSSFIPGAVLVDGRKVSFSSSSFEEIYRFIMTVSLVSWAARKF